MPPEPVADVELPRYGEASLSDLLPSTVGALGLPGEDNLLALPAADTYCVLLIDGLGWQLLRQRQSDAPFLSSLLHAPASRSLTTGVPSTTATSLTSLGTGLAPGRHGVVGYTTRVPGTVDQRLNALTWDQPVDPLAYQPHPTVLERAERAGVSVSTVTKRRFRQSGLTVCGLRGGSFRGADTFGERVAAVATATAGRGPALVYVYDSDLDFTGHRLGWRSEAWRYQLGMLDRFAEMVYEALPAGAVLVVTGDHGMVDVPKDARLDLDATPGLLEGIDLVAGEARFRHLYVKPGALDDVLATWRSTLGSRALVRSREEATRAGWFGAVEERVRERIGDVVVAAGPDFSLELPSVFPFETKLIGLHGGLCSDEVLVPLLVGEA